MEPASTLTDVAGAASDKVTETITWFDKILPGLIGFGLDILKLIVNFSGRPAADSGISAAD